MIRAEASIHIDAGQREVLESVSDLELYRQADTKITKVLHPPVVSEVMPHSRTRYRGRIRGIPTPPEWQSVELVPWRTLTFESEGGQWTNMLVHFIGGFVCEPQPDGGTTVLHFEQFTFKGPARWIAEPTLRAWLQRDIEREVQDLKILIETGPAE
ncbi:SRPBCC family protein [Nocardia sp. NPDC058658]|uniref:SRPBCC family protein n=1 Tax=Nocardia sp. NPDC058658 TaxID=3346580 RepID=UPI0036698ECC